MKFSIEERHHHPIHDLNTLNLFHHIQIFATQFSCSHANFVSACVNVVDDAKGFPSLSLCVNCLYNCFSFLRAFTSMIAVFKGFPLSFFHCKSW